MLYAFGAGFNRWYSYVSDHKLNESEFDINFLYNNMDITSSFDPIEEIFKNDPNPFLWLMEKV